MATESPIVIPGELRIDDRGLVAFANDFRFDDVKRFYVVSNHQKGFVRAWHGHKKEVKYVTVAQGTAMVCCVEIDDWELPDEDAQVQKYVLSSTQPSILRIPAGYANGFMPLTDDAKLMFFSTATLDESLRDDYRFPARYWNPWEIEER